MRGMVCFAGLKRGMRIRKGWDGDGNKGEKEYDYIYIYIYI